MEIIYEQASRFKLFYRIENPESALVFGVDEYLSNDNAILLVEWAERIEKLLPKNTVRAEISHSSETTRKISSKSRG